MSTVRTVVSRARGMLHAGLVLVGVSMLGPGPWSWAQQHEAGAVCTSCHDDERFAAFPDSVHGFLECADCHLGAEGMHEREQIELLGCATCHEDLVEQYRSSIHGAGRLEGHDEPPNCQACHGDVHTLRAATDPQSPIHRANLADTCGACHSDPVMVKKFRIPVVQPLAAFRKSVHARAVSMGNGGPTCSSCHESHRVLPASDPRSTVSHRNVPDTCGACHAQIAAVYRESVHGIGAAHGAREAPVCTDCHGEHRILSPREAGSPVFATNLPKMTCGRCHGDVRLAEKYGLPAQKVPAYSASYHGLASRAGVQTVANCASCHGVHDILPSTDPRSHIHPQRLAETCGRCHPGAGQTFSIGPVHVLPTDRQHVAVYWIRLIYLWLIVLTVGGMLLHNLLDFSRKVTLPRPLPSTRPPRERMMKGFRLAHALLVVSFAVLVYTGFALTYPEAWWARPIIRMEAALGLRGWLHRAAGVAMVVAMLIHFVHLTRDRRARNVITRMRPRRADLHEFFERMLYLLRLRSKPPRAPLIGYVEKIEYLAFMWGAVVMIVTGCLLWFEGPVLRWLPTWVVDVATVIHFYEAVLATSAIVVWHFYFVIFDPLVYPMDTAWITGREVAGRAAERRGQFKLPASAPGPDASQQARPSRPRPQLG